jgi:hypothetical protein
MASMAGHGAMDRFAQSRQAGALAAVAERVGSALVRSAAYVRRCIGGSGRRARQASVLPDYLLRDIGIKRCETSFGSRRRPARLHEPRQPDG